MQHYQDGEFPVAKTKVSSATSPDSGFASLQCRKNNYIRFQAGYATPLAELLWNVVAATYEMYAFRVVPENAVVTPVARAGPIA